MNDWIDIDGFNHLKVGKLADAKEDRLFEGTHVLVGILGATLLQCSMCLSLVTEAAIRDHIQLVHREAMDLVRERLAKSRSVTEREPE